MENPRKSKEEERNYGDQKIERKEENDFLDSKLGLITLIVIA